MLQENEITEKVIGAAIEVHRHLTNPVTGDEQERKVRRSRSASE